MNAYVVLFLRLPFLIIADTAHIAICVLSDFDLISQQKLNKITKGLEKSDAPILEFTTLKSIFIGQSSAIDDVVFM